MQFKTVTVCLFVLAALSNCKKEEKSNTPSKTDLLTSGQWRMTAYTLTPPMDLNGDSAVDSDGLAAMDACERDDLFIFQKGGTLTLDEGPTKCNPSDPQTEMAEWSFQNNETGIVIDGIPTVIQELTTSRLRVITDVGSSKGDITFTKL